MRVKLGDIGEIITGNTPKTSDVENYNSNDINFVKPSDIDENKITYISSSEFYISEYARNSARILPPKSVLVTCIGVIGKVAINNFECAFNQQINAIIPNTKKVLPNYLAYSVKSKKFVMERIANAPVVPILNKTQFSNIEISLPPLEEQKKIANTLDKLTSLIEKRQKQLEKLDLLVKAKFVEMFGDPVVNEKNIKTKKMPNLCKIIDGDRGKNYPKQSEFLEKGFCLFLNTKNVTSSGFCFNTCYYISEEKDNILNNGKLIRGDLVLTTRGTIGNIAFYDNSIPFDNIRINSGMVIIRLDKKFINEIFFIEQFKIKVNFIKEKIASGSAQPQLPISTMSKIEIILPKIEEQNKFADFVQQTEKSKLQINESLEKLETLKKALMQEYFN